MNILNTFDQLVDTSYAKQPEPKDFPTFSEIFKREFKAMQSHFDLDIIKNSHLPADEDDVEPGVEIFTLGNALEMNVDGSFSCYQWAIEQQHSKEFAMLYSERHTECPPDKRGDDSLKHNTYIRLFNQSKTAAYLEVTNELLRSGKSESYAKFCADFLEEEAFHISLEVTQKGANEHFKLATKAKELSFDELQTETFIYRQRFEEDSETYTIHYVNYLKEGIQSGKNHREAEAYATEMADLEAMDTANYSGHTSPDLSQSKANQFWDNLDDDDLAGWTDNMNKY